MNLEKLYAEIERLKEHFDAIDKRREVAYHTARELRRISVQAVRDIHQGKHDEALAHVINGKALAEELAKEDTHFGFIEEAMQEYSEAAFTLAFLKGEAPPSQAELGADERGYLLGLADTVGEIRRHTLDLLRQDRVDEAKLMMALMDDLHDLLLKFDHTDAVIPMRRKQDMLRGVVERTRADLTNIICQKRLENCISSHTSDVKE